MDNGDSTYLIGCGELNNCLPQKKKKMALISFSPLFLTHTKTRNNFHTALIDGGNQLSQYTLWQKLYEKGPGFKYFSIY